jgi:thioredoxin-like negative regulator of GroEL
MRFLRFPLAVLAAMAFALPAIAAQSVDFNSTQFAAAQAAGRPILVDIHAAWCPTCAAQKPIIETLTADPAFEHLLILRVDFDSQKDEVRAFGARQQSTLIAFHGNTETGRSVGDTNADSIGRLLHSALN